ncbi:hypothetical protein V6N13_009890 [Hibiscus sabdariffa]|uniref:Uncharacterized protein n=1 Tax=Hibiscus sabdariffa TaxID=183260 RepID=A0ABR2BC81_9ROSI
MVAGSKLQVEDETLNTCVIGKERNKSEATDDFRTDRFLGKSVLKSNENNVVIPAIMLFHMGKENLALNRKNAYHTL